MSNSKGFVGSLLWEPLLGVEVGAFVVDALPFGGDFAGVPGLEDGVAGRDSGIVDSCVVFQPIGTLVGLLYWTWNGGEVRTCQRINSAIPPS
jgi:hypothetical protein